MKRQFIINGGYWDRTNQYNYGKRDLTKRQFIINGGTWDRTNQYNYAGGMGLASGYYKKRQLIINGSLLVNGTQISVIE